MKKKPDCRHQWPEVPECSPVFRNIYECDDCDVRWEEDWSCGCSSACPGCELDVCPVSSEEIAPCACEVLR